MAAALVSAALVSAVTVPAASAADHKTAPAAPPLPDIQPVLRIPVAPLGYLPPGPILLTYRVPGSTLNFIDDTHLLFTFRANRLMHRLPDETEADEDRVIHALILDLKPGKDADGNAQVPGVVSAQADWRMHDHGRYLWSLGHGRFLVRSRNTLYEIDRGLHFTPYVRPDDPLTEVNVSADRSLLAVQSESEPRQTPAALPAPMPAPNVASPPGLTPTPASDVLPRRKRSFELSIIRTETNKVDFHAVNPVPVHLPLVQEGYTGVTEDDAARNSWNVNVYAFTGGTTRIASVRSSCRPDLEPLSGTVVLVTGCTRDSADHLEQAFTLKGKLLWEQRWGARYVWPTFEVADDGSRFAFASIELQHPIGVLDPVDETEITRQLVGVYDTADGRLRIVRDLTPILSAGQNYALSADGTRFAVLRDGAIEVYELPPAPVY